MFLTRSVLNLAFLALLASCTSTVVAKKPPCQELSWFEKGRQDGMRGEPSNNWKILSKACQNMSTEMQRDYADGWNNGLTLFCTEEHGFVIAKSGQAYKKTCPERYEAAFLRGYGQGLKYFLIEKENTQIVSQLESINTQLRKTRSNDSERSRLTRERQLLETKKQSNLEKLENFQIL